VPEAERAMAKSLERYGQLSPVVVCRRNDRYELIDGFKRLGAVRRLTQIDHLSARLVSLAIVRKEFPVVLDVAVKFP
jgi:hypothetical protein